MKAACAVIGMNYGDEGKGHITNYLSDAETLNVRFNGGAQAAHAVSTSAGLSHVFHHFGSGTLRGARTLLSRRFIVNPILYMRELHELLGKVPMRETFIDPRCVVTTPYDMLINHVVAKQTNSHATAGCGINETVERSEYDQLCLTMRQVKDMDEAQLAAKIEQIENEWVPFRVEQHGMDVSEFRRSVAGTITDRMVETYLDYCRWLAEKAVVWEDANIIDRYLRKHTEGQIVFEGAQGLLLDQRRREFFPYLTRSNTGLRNVKFILADATSDLKLHAYGVTRSYLTRHGDGPMMDERAMPYADETNPENQYQGAMRYGLLSTEWYKKALTELQSDADYACVAVTCVDQTGETVQTAEGQEQDIRDLPEVFIVSEGTTERDVRVLVHR